ncbi:unnamed protein product [Effrenium voratum]|uniref:Uncharacterized protein n=1 Tax=Effrenium voratum TaxID=2562239 RepID=A0AA36N032_9DINO|nr:unnamed protein product [Effrenium voratum]
MAMVAFFYSWYSMGGLRCQMCLFNAAHCGDWDPLGWENLLLTMVMVLSASSNQLLIRGRNGLETLDSLMSLMFRSLLFGFSVLPLGTAFYLSALWFHYPGKWSLVIACIAGSVPMVLGVFAITCVPLLCFARTPCGSALLLAVSLRLETLLPRCFTSA